MIKTPHRRTINGKPMVLLEEAEYQRLLRQADAWEPALPETDRAGNYPALAAMAVIQFDILRERHRLGLTQAELARSAGIRLETVHRIETAKNRPNVRTMETIAPCARPRRRKKSVKD